MNTQAGRPKHIPWERFWCPLGSSYAASEEGFLQKSAEFDLSPHAKRIDQFGDLACLVLLGGPGMGKTEALKQAFEEDTGLKRFFDLGDFTEGQAVSNAIFQDRELTDWLESTAETVTLYIDSLDECMIDVRGLGRVLGAGFRNLQEHVPRLRLRVACRVANWPVTLQQNLEWVWGAGNLAVVELLPLRLQDVTTAADIYGADPDAFVAALEATRSGPLATKPVTLLRMLLPEFIHEQKLPASQLDLYRRGCRRLVEEWSPAVMERAATTTDQLDTRYRAAGYLASAMMFSGHSIVDSSKPRGETRPGAIHLGDVCPAIVEDVERDVQPPPGALEQVLKTALMTVDGASSAFRFEHRSYQEFLCAEHLNSLNLPLKRLLPLFMDEDSHVAPQLAEVAGWLASMHLEFRDTVLDRDPVVLLRADPVTKDTDTRRALFHRLCDLLRQRLDNDREWDPSRTYAGIPYEGLETDLLAILQNYDEPGQVREFAVDVVRYGRLNSMLDTVVDIALDASRPLAERENCTRTVADSDPTSAEAIAARQRLTPLLKTTSEEDPFDTLRGCALQALWPDHISAGLAFSCLTPPHEDRFHGSFQTLCHQMGRSLQPVHLPAALDWATAQPPRHEMPFCFRTLLDAIFAVAWRNLAEAGIEQRLAVAAAARLEHYEGLWGDREYAPTRSEHPDPRLTAPSTETRESNHSLCLAVSPLIAGKQGAAFGVSYWLKLVDPEDMAWVLEQYVSATEDAMRSFWLDLSIRIWDGSDAQVSVVRSVGGTHPAVADAFAERLALLDPDSKESRRLRDQQAEWEAEMTRQFPKAPPPEVPAAKIVDQLLESFEGGDAMRWWEVADLLTVTEGSSYFGDRFEPHVTKLPGWIESSAARRAQIVKHARLYLEQANDVPADWVGKSLAHFPAMAGVKALLLLREEDPAGVEQLAPNVWARWTHAILGYPNAVSGELLEVLRPLALACFGSARQEFLAAVERFIRSERPDASRVEVLYALDFDWDAALQGLLLNLVKTSDLGAGCMQHILNELVKRGCGSARVYAFQRLSDLASSPDLAGLETARFKAWALPLLTHEISKTEWGPLWQVIRDKPELGISLFSESFRYDIRSDEVQIYQHLDDEQIAELCIWLRRQFPVDTTDPRTHLFGNEDRIEGLSGRLPSLLASRGTPRAIRALEHLRDELKDDWLADVLIYARKALRQSQWEAISPHDLCVYLGNAKARVVRNESELFQVVMEALENINARLQGSPPRAQFLWDKIDKKRRPKDEASLSDWLKGELSDALNGRNLSILREVEVRRGDKTDVHVTVPSTRSAQEFGVIIEVKGCWNDGVETDIKDQLAGRYLVHSEFRHGIYVVGWFYDDGWDEGDQRRERRAKGFQSMTLEEAQRHFASLAQAASGYTTTVAAVVLDCQFPGK